MIHLDRCNVFFFFFFFFFFFLILHFGYTYNIWWIFQLVYLPWRPRCLVHVSIADMVDRGLAFIIFGLCMYDVVSLRGKIAMEPLRLSIGNSRVIVLLCYCEIDS
ncbi:hypothetical protein ACN38_g11737 [Penicillium nordicum]|uniref:Uncharacterized protein n=1 Tax=Penicillium nordicum TaxID=229535 RepID=A0A0M8NQS0_9EURO|nr:hypothetical protein ACN38_g11737 [Penicillium nordicum]